MLPGVKCESLESGGRVPTLQTPYSLDPEVPVEVRDDCEGGLVCAFARGVDPHLASGVFLPI